MKLTQKVTSTTQRVLVYGAPKSGKTELVGGLAEKFNLLWFDCEQGYNTLRKLPIEWQERINIISIPDSRVFPIAAETWLKVIKGAKVSICEEHGKVTCLTCKKEGKFSEDVCLDELASDTIVVFDSVTQLTNSLIAHITKSQPDDYKLQLDDWGNLRVLVDKFLSQIQAAGYNVVCITHEEEVEMEDGRKKIVPVSGSSKSSRNTAKYFDTVVYCDVKNKKHTFASTTCSINGVITGSRTGQVLDGMANPSLLDIFSGCNAAGTIPMIKPKVLTPAQELLVRMGNEAAKSIYKEVGLSNDAQEVLKLSGAMREIPIATESEIVAFTAKVTEEPKEQPLTAKQRMDARLAELKASKEAKAAG
jgi:hypothetical protein